MTTATEPRCDGSGQRAWLAHDGRTYASGRPVTTPTAGVVTNDGRTPCPVCGALVGAHAAQDGAFEIVDHLPRHQEAAALVLPW